MRTAGVKSLLNARLYGSTSRIIDVGRLVERALSSSEEGQVQAPFNARLLNSSLIFKHTLRSAEREYFYDTRHTAVKIVFPLISNDLDMGGHSIFVNEKNFRISLARFLNLAEFDEYIEADIRLLEMLDRIPSFDPFLISERALADGIQLEHGIFDLSHRDSKLLRQTVANSLADVVRSAMPDENTNYAAERLAASFMDSNNLKPLYPLREALKLLPDDFKDTIFAWKGILYYSWKVEFISSKFQDIVSGLGLLEKRIIDREWKTIIRKKITRIARVLNISIVRVSEDLIAYESAIRSVESSGSPSELISFLNNASDMFKRIGDAMGLITHCLDYWSFATEGIQIATVSEDYAFDIVLGMAEPISAEAEVLEFEFRA